MTTRIDHGDNAEMRGLVKGDVEMNHAGLPPHSVAIDMEPQAAAPALRKSSRKSEITVRFEDVKYKVVLKDSTGKWYNPLKSFKHSDKEILHGVTGSVLPGEVLAMMGPSGSGKTTFLSLLGGRAQGVTSGTVTYNGLPYNKGLKRMMGFVTQDDIFFPHLTVRETLMYAALLRLPRDLTQAQKIQRVEDTIVELGLERCRNTIIGGQFLRGVSGGERKRVSIGHEILIDPAILLLDEPTSGLDSTTALKIVQVLQKLAHSGRTVVTTIHQPSSRLFHSFDKLLLLAEGSSVFFGKASDAMGYFDRIGFTPMFATNPADFLLDLANGNTAYVSVPKEFSKSDVWAHKPPTEQAADVKKHLIASAEEHLLPHIKAFLQSLPEPSQKEKNFMLEKRAWNATWTEQFCLLMSRGFKERRHEVWSGLKIGQILVISFIVGCLWYNSDLRTFTRATDQIGLLFFISIFWGFFPLISAIFTFPQERAMLAKERASDMYQLSAYFLSRTLADIPMEWALPTLFLVITYFMANLKLDVGVFFYTLLAIFLTISAAQGLGFLIGAVVMDVKMATTLASVVILTFMLTGGYYLQVIPGWIAWMKYISFNFYSYKLIMKVQYSNSDTYGCGPIDNVGSVQCPISEVLKGITLGGGWTESYALLIMVVVYRFLAYVALRRMKTGV